MTLAVSFWGWVGILVFAAAFIGSAIYVGIELANDRKF